MGTTTAYVPYDYRRTCDLCGNLYNISKMFRKGPYTYCLDHSGERINEELDRGNARQRPFRILPVPNAKPEDQGQPDVWEAERSTIFNLLDFVTANGARYAQVASGNPGALATAADVIPTNAWACAYYYSLALAIYPRGHHDMWHDLALARIRTCADRILALQSTSGTVATNAFYGALLASGATAYYSEDASTGGLALLYAYRLLGDLKYLYGARACASFLRNCQAIGSSATHFTSTDGAGTSRLSLGAIVNSVSTTAGFYSDGLFYLSGLHTYQFWNELKLTDGDSTLGATAVISGSFDTAPAQAISTSMAQLRAFWETGTRDATTGDVRTGLSTLTPSDRFNAFPNSKANSSVIGTGSWEYADGNATLGTKITALNWAKALSALWAVEGASSIVTAIDAWFQTFTSNASLQTPAISSAGSLARATTGTYDPTQGIARLLLVRDSTNGYAATTKNGSALYDWGSFGLLAPIWASRHARDLISGRNQAARERRRLSDGLPSDGFWDDSGLLRGRQGMSYQTAFYETLIHGVGP